MSDNIASDPLFVGLTRPPLIFGVSMHFALLNLLISSTAFIQSSSIKIIFFAAIIHFVGYILCFKEPRFLELYINKFSRCNQCTNKRYYGANSYSI